MKAYRHAKAKFSLLALLAHGSRRAAASAMGDDVRGGQQLAEPPQRGG